MNDDMVDLGQGALLIPGLDMSVDLSNLEALIVRAEQEGSQELEIETTT